jgi:5'-nucleotidase
LSQAFGYGHGDVPPWETAIAHAPKLIHDLLAEDWPARTCMNVNFPDRAPDNVEGIRITEQGRRDMQLLGVEERRDTWGTPYYWLGYEKRRSNPTDTTDLWAIYNGWISVTPLTMNLTHHDMIARLKPRFAK